MLVGLFACTSGCAVDAADSDFADESAENSDESDPAIDSSEEALTFAQFLSAWRARRDASVATPADAGVSPPKDAAAPAQQDAAVTPVKDAAVAPPKDAATSTPQDASVAPPKDAAVTPPRDAAVTPPKDASTTPTTPVDAGTTPTASSKTLRIEGRRILDTCGQPFVARGVEQITGTQFSHNGTLLGLVDELVKTGSNAVRLLTQNATASEIDSILGAFGAQKVVVYISPGDRAWFKRSDIKPVLLKHEKTIIIDAFQEPTYDDVPRWVSEAKVAIADMRNAGYSAPLTVLSNQYGRDLQAAFDRGQEIVNSDPLKNTIIGWQAYWGNSGWYQSDHGLSLSQGVDKCATMPFAMQVGIDLYADGGDLMDYISVMAASQRNGIGWLWWNFWNPWDGLGNNATTDGTTAHLTPAGQIFMKSDANSIERTSKKACFR